MATETSPTQGLVGRLLKGVKGEAAAAFILGALLLTASMAPIPYRFAVAPPNQVYNGTEFWSDDYSAYVSYIIQGQQGKWLAYDTHTSEPDLPGIVIHEEYVLWGKLTGIFGISAIYAYHLFRLVLGAILLTVLWQFIKLIFDESLLRLTAYFLVLFVGGLPKTLVPTVTGYIPWLTELDIFSRFVALPHYLLGNIFFLLSLIQFIKFTKLQRHSIFNSSFFFLILSGLATGFTHAVSLITLYATLAIVTLLKIAIRLSVPFKKTGVIVKSALLDVSILILFALLTVPLLIYFRYLLTFLPWANLSLAWEAAAAYTTPPRDILFAIGPAVFLAPVGFLLLLLRKQVSVEKLVLISWLLAFFLLFYFSHPFLNIAQRRFLQTYFFIPVGLLAAPVVVSFSAWVGRQWHVSRNLAAVTALFLLFIPTFPLLRDGFFSRFATFSDFGYLTYPPKDWVAGIYWLRDNTSHDSVVLGTWQAGHHIPFMAGNYVYWGHRWGTLEFLRKEELVKQFFGGKMTLEKARQFLIQGRVDYVFYGYEERSYGGDLNKYRGLLTPAYEQPVLTIFKFQH